MQKLTLNKPYPFNKNAVKATSKQTPETYCFCLDGNNQQAETIPYTSKIASSAKKTSTTEVAKGNTAVIYTQANHTLENATAKKQLKGCEYSEQDVITQNFILNLISQAKNSSEKQRIHPTLILATTSGVLPYLPFPTMESVIHGIRQDSSAIQQLANDIFFLNNNNVYLKDAHAKNFLYDKETHTIHSIDMDKAQVGNVAPERESKLRTSNLTELLENLSLDIFIKDFIKTHIKEQYQLQETGYSPLKETAKNFIEKYPGVSYAEIFT